MIGSLHGIIELREDPYVLLEVNGVGYKVMVSSEVLSQIILKEKIKIFTYTHVREDILELFGFSHPDDLKLFERLIGVSGIGPKTAMGVFSIGSRNDIIQAILSADTAFFMGVPRLGKKNAQKLIIELKGKLGSVSSEIDLAEGESSNEIVAALLNFGFSSREAYEALKEVKDKGSSVSEKIKLALKYLGK